MLEAPTSADTLRAFAARHDWTSVLDRFLAALGLDDASAAAVLAEPDHRRDAPLRSTAAAP
jgi:hypothetical protein